MIRNVVTVMYWTWQGRRVGNKVARLMEIRPSLYHSAMEEGGCQLHLMKLYHLKKMGVPLELIAHDSCKFLFAGLVCIEQAIGPQALTESAKFKVVQCDIKNYDGAGSCFL
ncbi:hypothetical protein PCPL58_2798 [Pseudomonas cerasi]|uniref:Uncharacterized protein n=2 Tax=Pseudomonas cerasi TaxID=1583341 RepID=A0A193SQ97_9PSED|nr:hypothetical protein PCPL58_2798 [Pseudomonas cerasi]SOS20974.1 hypothetical protein PL963_02876 [Pseudomonas cerasi]